MKNPLWLRLTLVVALYVGLKFYGGDIGAKVLYPVTLLVTFLHEFGHALGALITGGEVLSIEIEETGAGKTWTAGGWRSVILMGGYIGSALLGNLLFYIGAKWEKAAPAAVGVLCALMVMVGLFWHSSLFSTGFLIAFAFGLFFLGKFTNLHQEILMFLGLASIIYIVQDFRIGPSSDLEEYAKVMVIFPKVMWMYIWLGIVLILCFFNLRLILSSSGEKETLGGEGYGNQ